VDVLLLSVGAATRLRRGVAAAPFPERLDDRAEASTLGREVIFEPRRMLAVRPARGEAARFHLLQARGQRVGRDARERLLEVLEAARSVPKKVENNQDRPALADEIERARDRAIFLPIGASHAAIVASKYFNTSNY